MASLLLISPRRRCRRRWRPSLSRPARPPSAQPVRRPRAGFFSLPPASPTHSRTSAIAVAIPPQSRAPTFADSSPNSCVSFPHSFTRLGSRCSCRCRCRSLSTLGLGTQSSCIAAIKPWEHCMIFPRLWLSAHNAILRNDRERVDIKSISRYDPSVQTHPWFRRDRTPPGTRNVRHQSLGENQWWRALGASSFPASHYQNKC